MTSSAIASACSKWRSLIAVAASRSLALAAPVVMLAGWPAARAAAALGRAFLISSLTFAGRVVEEPPLHIEGLGLVGLAWAAS